MTVSADTQSRIEYSKGAHAEECVQVNLGERSYSVTIAARGLLETIPTRLSSLSLPSRCLIVSSPQIWHLYGERLGSSLRDAGYDWQVHTIPDGEQHKTVDSFTKLITELYKFEQNQPCFILSFGGGVVGDIAGFGASTFRRGIDYVHVPTTLLAMVDCAVGGKVGVNLPEAKNVVGQFYQPRAVFADVSVLETLPKREVRSGLAETLKYGAVWDEEFFHRVEKDAHLLVDIDVEALVPVIKRACEIKASIVHADERDTQDLRAILNFGHTFGHAFEAATAYEKYLHGEAIAIGMGCANDLAIQMDILKRSDADRLEKVLENIGLPTYLEGVDVDFTIRAMRHDKKIRAGKIRIVVLNSIGRSQILPHVPESQLRSIISNRTKQ